MTYSLIGLGAVCALTRDGGGTLLPEMFAPDRYDCG
ncbi:MAG: hypothetical protein JWP92_649 [Caulobacter sp.]|nr:hypothetical protein [Caulobacter sp.]